MTIEDVRHSEIFHVNVSVPRKLFYEAMDPKLETYVAFGIWVHLGMWKTMRELIPDTAIFHDMRTWLDDMIAKQAEIVPADPDMVSFVVSIPQANIGRTWSEIKDKDKGDYYHAGLIAVHQVMHAIFQINTALDMRPLLLETQWEAERELVTKAPKLLDEAEELLGDENDGEIEWI